MAHRANTPRLLVPFVGALLCAAPASALDPRKAISQYVHEIWRTEQGLPLDEVQALAQTPDGYLWIGTEEGLVRFDGVRFQSSIGATRRSWMKTSTPSLRIEQARCGLVPGAA